jgi:hypothetical protein
MAFLHQEAMRQRSLGGDPKAVRAKGLLDGSIEAPILSNLTLFTSDSGYLAPHLQIRKRRFR